MSGKGDRPRSCYSERYREGWERVFGKGRLDDRICFLCAHWNGYRDGKRTGFCTINDEDTKRNDTCDAWEDGEPRFEAIRKKNAELAEWAKGTTNVIIEPESYRPSWGERRREYARQRGTYRDVVVPSDSLKDLMIENRDVDARQRDTTYEQR